MAGTDWNDRFLAQIEPTSCTVCETSVLTELLPVCGLQACCVCTCLEQSIHQLSGSKSGFLQKPSVCLVPWPFCSPSPFLFLVSVMAALSAYCNVCSYHLFVSLFPQSIPYYPHFLISDFWASADATSRWKWFVQFCCLCLLSSLLGMFRGTRGVAVTAGLPLCGSCHCLYTALIEK